MDSTQIRQAEVQVVSDLTRILQGALTLAVEKSPADAIDMVCEYIEECGVRCEDPPAGVLLDKWWASRKTTTPDPRDEEIARLESKCAALSQMVGADGDLIRKLETMLAGAKAVAKNKYQLALTADDGTFVSGQQYDDIESALHAIGEQVAKESERE